MTVTVDDEVTEHQYNNKPISFKVSPNKQYTISFGEIENYKTPSPQTFNSISYNVRKISLCYEAELLTLTIKDENGKTMSHQSVTINNKLYDTNGFGMIETLIPFGTSYTISFSETLGYEKVQDIQLVAGEMHRQINVTYMYKTLSVSYFMKDKTIMERYKNFDPTRISDISGILVSNDDHEFIMALDRNDSTWQDGKGTYYNGVTAYYTYNEAIFDYNGQENTEIILEYLGSGNDHIAGWCSNYQFPHGCMGWLPSIGEWYMVLENKQLIQDLLDNIGLDLKIPVWGLSSNQYPDDPDVMLSLYLGDNASGGVNLYPAEKDYQPEAGGNVAAIPFTSRTQYTYAYLTYAGQKWKINFEAGQSWFQWGYDRETGENTEEGNKYNFRLIFASPFGLTGPQGSGYENTKLMLEGGKAGNDDDIIIPKHTYTLVPWVGYEG